MARYNLIIKGAKQNAVDTAVIYYSRADACWIAHSLRTDQIGTGGRIVDALADLIKAILQVCELAKKDQTIAVLRPAPKEIRDLVKRAKPLPRESYEVAHRMVHNQWPEYIEPDFKPRDEGESFTTEVLELAL